MFIMRRITLALVAVTFLAVTMPAKTPGTFRGVLVDAPAKSKSDGWVFVKGKNGMLRKVEIRQATVRYEDGFPQEKRDRSPRAALRPGIEVRVTATQGNDGEWHASDVEIVDPDGGNELPPDPDPDHRIT